MPKLNAIILAGFLASSLHVRQSNAQCWVYQKSDTTISFRGLSFPDSDIGIAVGDQGTVLRTTDNGVHWTPQSTRQSYELHRISFGDARNGAIVGFDSYEWSGLILYTTDGGLSWVRQVSGTGSSLWAISFPTTNVGVTVGLNGTILRTTNGGQRWSKLASGTTQDLIGVCFTSPSTGTVVGANGTILRTTDSGVTWRSQVSNASLSLYDISFVDPHHGIIVGNGGTILQTTDGGETWANRKSGASKVLISVSYTTINDAAIVGWDAHTDEGVIFRTANGGVSWDSVSCPKRLYSVAASHGKTAVGVDGTIIHLSDSCVSDPQAVLVSPIDGAEHLSLTTLYDMPPLFSFAWSILPDLQVTGTRVQVASSADFAREIVFDGVALLNGSMINTSLSTSVLKPGRRYYWRATAVYNDGSTGSWSAAWSFTTASGVISGVVFEDIDRNGIQDSGDRGVPHQRIDIAGSVTGVRYTDDRGEYSFVGLGAGQHIVSEALEGPAATSVPVSGFYAVTLGVSDTASGCNFGNYEAWNSVSGTLYYDQNENGIQDSAEPGLSNWLIRVQNNRVDTALTDAEGRFAFTALVLGEYSLTVDMKTGWEQTYPQSQEGYGIYFSNYNQRFDGKNFGLRRIPPRVKVVLNVRDSAPADKRNIWFGMKPGAARGIWGADPDATIVDFTESEFDLPPPLPGLFDARFIDPRPGTAQFGFGSWTDMRDYVSPSQSDTFQVQFQPGWNFGGDYPMLLRWSTAAISSAFDGDVVIFDPRGNAADMKRTDSLLIEDPSVTTAVIIAHRPKLPVVSAEEYFSDLPREFALLQNYPNPFNPLTVIRYQLPPAGAGHVRLIVYNLLGQVVTVLVDAMQEAGYKSVEWNASALPSGVYFYRLSAGSYSNAKKTLLLR